MATLFHAPNIEKIAAILQKKGMTINLSSLVPIQPKGSNPALFCIHAGGGYVHFYYDFAKNLGSDQPVYGLQAKGINGKEPFDTRIEDMAAHYIQDIRSVQPEGPYFLAGYCFGGIIAFEIAQQLIREGDKVSLLTIFNSRSPTYNHVFDLDAKKDTKEVQGSTISLSSKISGYVKKISLLSSTEQLALPLKIVKKGLRMTGGFLYYKSRAKVFRVFIKARKFGYNFYLSRGLLLPKLLRQHYLLNTNATMAKAYKPEVYHGRIIVFRSPKIFTDPYLGWRDYVAGDIDTYDVPGDYKYRHDVMKEPFVQFISDKLKSYIATQMQESIQQIT